MVPFSQIAESFFLFMIVLQIDVTFRFFSSGYKIGIKNLLRPDVRDFWEKLGSLVAPKEEGGHVDLFVPLGASGQF